VIAARIRRPRRGEPVVDTNEDCPPFDPVLVELRRSRHIDMISKGIT
jgi:hypothetical protein